MVWVFGCKGPSGFSARSTAEEVTEGVDGSGLVAIVTGAGSGFGAETTRVLSLRGVRVVMAVRSSDLYAATCVKDGILQENSTAQLDIMELDLASMASVRKFASEFTASKLPLNILINNAGIMATPFLLSQDGIELQFATNYLGHFLLTHLLLETMKSTAQKNGIEGRIVNLSSIAHKLTYKEGIRFDKINNKYTSDAYSTRAYGQSKLANLLHANELSRRLKEEGVRITANSLHPGVSSTKLWRYHPTFGKIVDAVSKFTMKSVAQGAATTCYVALNPQVRGVSGRYFCDSNEANPSKLGRDPVLAKKLWDFSMDLIK